MDYECHITIDGNPEVIKPIVEEAGWFFSYIKRDPVLGLKSKCYATNHYQTEREAIEQIQRTAINLCNKKICVVRIKVEHIIMDVIR